MKPGTNTPLLNGFNLGRVRIEPPLLLAPMAGITHVAFRQIVARFGGCGLYVSEMLSARAVPHERLMQSFFLKRRANERPFFYQLAGNDPDHMVRAIHWLQDESARAGLPLDGFDINMGCAAPPVRNSGQGVGLMRTPELAARIVGACRKGTDLSLTAKVRLGWVEAFESTRTFVQLLENEGLDGVTLHPRLAKERFTRRARWGYVKALKEEIRIPLIGNGDIRAEQDAVCRMEQTGCDGIMIGRLAVQKPWVFAATCDRQRVPTLDLREIFHELVRGLELDCPKERRMGRLREFTPYFALNFRFGHRLRSAIQNAACIEQALEEADRFFERNREELRVTPSASAFRDQDCPAD